MTDHDPTAEDLHAVAQALGLLPIPDRLMPLVLAQVRAHRANVARFEASGLDVADVVTAQPYRVEA
jgi:hypothetical protein